MKAIEINEIVQLSPTETKNKMFAACLMIVTDIRPWGVQGYVQGLGSNGESAGQAFYRAENGTFETTGGRAIWSVNND